MPPYELIVFLRPAVTPQQLSSLFRNVARIVFREQGQFRRVENLGVRPLAYPLRKSGARYEEVRWVSATFDAAPPVLAAVKRIRRDRPRADEPANIFCFPDADEVGK
jgi:ribosomal protein S6